MLRNSFRDLRLLLLSKSLDKSYRLTLTLNNVRISGSSTTGKDGQIYRKTRKKPVQKHVKVAHILKNNMLSGNLSGEEVFKPIMLEPIKKADVEATDIGVELAGKLTKGDKTAVLRMFTMDKSIQMLAAQHGIEGNMFDVALQSFRKYCIDSVHLPVEQHIVFRDLVQKVGHITDLFPFFLSHAKTVFPHLDCMEDLQKISDLTEPSQWYPLARSMHRKIIFHAGPTNSGKTYHALKRFMESGSGVYCGPLRLLAMEVFSKCNDAEVPCDLITGETRRYANEDETPAEHVACTVEMANLSQEYDVAVIDEIQMIGDLQRGWSWSRTLLGIAAKEVHVCGEETAIDLVKNLTDTTGDSFEVRRYQRLTSLTYLDKALGSFSAVKPGDCIVCFSKKDIFKVFNVLVAKGYKCAVIYGDLPPGTKIMQSQKFNDPKDPCNVLVATDAVGMGLNLAIKRVVFYSLTKYTLREDHTRAVDYLSTSQAQQIGGRAGRFRTQFEDGEVTTFWDKDLKHLHKIVNTEKHNLEKAGINPTAEMIEMFSYHLPKASLSNLLDIFVHVSKLDELYFMCNLMQFKELSQLIEHIPLPLKTRYTLCSSPLKVRKGFAQVMFVKIALRMSQGLPLTFDWLCQVLGAPFSIPKSVSDLEHLEGAFDVVDIYLWLSYRYPDMFVDPDDVRQMRVVLDSKIQTFLNRGRISEKKRRRLDLSHIAGQSETITAEEQEAELIQNNPLQAFTPKPKPKKETERHKVFTDVYKELEEMERVYSENEGKAERVISEHTDAVKDTGTLESKNVDDTAQEIKDSSDTVMKDTAENIETVGEEVIDVAKDTSEDIEKVAKDTSEDIEKVAKDTSEDIEKVAKDTSDDIEKVAKDTSEDIEKVRQELIVDTAENLDETDKFETRKMKGFLTRNTDLYNEFAGSYNIKTMFKTKESKPDNKVAVSEKETAHEEVTKESGELSEKPITAESVGPAETTKTDDIKEIALRLGLDEKEFRQVITSLKNRRRVNVEEKPVTGMTGEEMAHLKNMLTSLKKTKMQERKKNTEDEKLYRSMVQSYPKKQIKHVINDFQLSENEGLRGNEVVSSHLSFSKRFAVLSGRGGISSYSDTGSDSEGEHLKEKVSELSNSIKEENVVRSSETSSDSSSGISEQSLQLQPEATSNIENVVNDKELDETDVENRFLTANMSQTNQLDHMHVFYTESTSNMSGETENQQANAGTEKVKCESLEEKLLKQGVLSKEMIEKLKEEWKRNKVDS